MDTATPIKRVYFDFREDGFKDSVRKLDEILCSGGWTCHGLMYDRDETLLLAQLLHVGGIGIFEREFTLREDCTPEVRARAGELFDEMRKRSGGGMMSEISRLFPHEFEHGRTLHNAPFYPTLKAYIRCGSLSPEWIFEMLEKEDCERIILFPDGVISTTEGVHYFIVRSMPRSDFMEELQTMKDKRLSLIYEMLQGTNHDVFPRPREDS